MTAAGVSMKRAACLALLTMVACGSDDRVDLTGVYSVDRHMADPEGCTREVAVAESPGPYVRFSENELLGQEYFEWEWCADAAGASCEEYSGYTLYGEPIDDGWESRITLSSYSGEQCTVAVVRSTATLAADLMVIETRS